MICKQDIITIYQYISRKVDNRPDWQFTPTAKQEVMFTNYVQLLEKEYGMRSIGRRFVMEYFAYQYLRWFEKDDTRFGSTVMISWLIGKKAFERWMVRSDGWLFRARQKILGPYAIALESIFPLSGTRYDAAALFSHEELIKERFRGSVDRIGHCVESTTLFNRRSKWCITCSDKKSCKDLLRAMYPSLYLQRGYGTKD